MNKNGRIEQFVLLHNINPQHKRKEKTHIN